jgi:hypothetical protein
MNTRNDVKSFAAFVIVAREEPLNGDLEIFLKVP